MKFTSYHLVAINGDQRRELGAEPEDVKQKSEQLFDEGYKILSCYVFTETGFKKKIPYVRGKEKWIILK